MTSLRTLAALAAALFLVVLLAAGAERLLLVSQDSASAVELLAALLGVLAAAFAAATWRRSEAAREREMIGRGLAEAQGISCYTVARDGRVRTWNPGAEALFGWSAREVISPGAAADAWRLHDTELLPEMARLFETGRGHAPRARRVTHRNGTVVETVCVLVPVERFGRVVRVGVVDLDPRPPQAVDARWTRLFHEIPAGLLSIDAGGRIDAVNRRLADWVGRTAEALVGTEAARSEVFPPDFRERLGSLLAAAGEGRPGAECEVTLVDAAGIRRPCVAVVLPAGERGADVVFVDGTSRQQLAAERDAARAAAEAAREAASSTVTQQRDLTTSVAQLVSALEAARRENGMTPRRVPAEEELERSGRILLANIERLDETGRRREGDAAPQVLLVDDNDENRDLIAHMLRLRGAAVTAVASGREALDAVATRWFDVVLLDLQMPEMDGYDVTRGIRALPGGGSVAVVALTALGSEAVRERCLSQGMDDFVSKPVTMAKIGEILSRWGRRSAAPARG